MKVTNERKIVKLKEKGITLIALVVTIIILLILAGIAINLALGENGLITKSKLAKEEYDKEALKEEIMLAKVDKEIELSRELNEAEIMDLLEQYGDFVSEEDGTVKFKPNGSSYEIPYEEMKDELGVESSSKIVTITFDSNGGNGNMNKMHTTAGEPIKLSENLFSKEHAGFGKWNTDKTGSGTSYNDGDTITVDNDTTLYAMWANYGTKIEDNYEHIYSNYSSQVDEFDGQTIPDFAGNYGGKLYFFSVAHVYRNNIPFIQSGKYGNASISTEYSIAKKGENIYSISGNTKNEWILFIIKSGGGTVGGTASNFRLKFENSESITVEEAVTSGYVEPLVLCESAASLEYNGLHIWRDCMNLLKGGSTTANGCCSASIILKITDKADLKECQFDANMDWNEVYDGLFATILENVQLSTTPF